jgi:L-2-hydroxyglutarate oxidase LhgO
VARVPHVALEVVVHGRSEGHHEHVGQRGGYEQRSRAAETTSDDRQGIEYNAGVADAGLTIVGAGAVGLAVAARLARRFPDLVVLERHARHGQETSSRNSEVVHAGLYYPTDSLKAKLCVRGNRLLYEVAERHGLPHRRTGKLIVATQPSELPELDRLQALGRANGVPLERLAAEAARAREPHVAALEALFSPTSGVVSAHALMDFLLQQATTLGAVLQPRAELVALEHRGPDYVLTVRSPEGTESFSSERVVNAAGLDSDTVAALAGIDLDAAGYRLHWCKGRYFAVTPGKASLVRGLVYPVPDRVSLGVHAVVDWSGGLKFGPDVEYLAERRHDYTVDPGLRPAFAAGVRRLVPAIEEPDLLPDMAGIRAKLQGPRDGFRDFVACEEAARGRPGLVNLVGIDSPGLTSCLALAEHVDALLP